MARISYDEQTAAAFKAVREVPRDGLAEWREAVRRHLRPSQGMTLVDIGAGTGAFAAAFSDWFDLRILAVEPSPAMRDQIPRTSAIQVFEGDASALPLADASADAAWLSLVIHHIPDLAVAAREIRRVLRPGAPVLIRQGFPDRYEPLGEAEARQDRTRPMVPRDRSHGRDLSFHQGNARGVRRRRIPPGRTRAGS
jgi:SAM-dependent methyltransferase